MGWAGFYPPNSTVDFKILMVEGLNRTLDLKNNNVDFLYVFEILSQRILVHGHLVRGSAVNPTFHKTRNKIDKTLYAGGGV